MSGDYRRGEMLAAAQVVGSNPDSAPAYRAFVVEVERLRPQFSAEVALEAERNLVFLGLGPLRAAASLPEPEQLERLALTVWPTVLEVVPRADETPMGYIQRVCGEHLIRECKAVVPEYWPLVVGGLVWKRFRDRARRANADCFGCVEAAGYADAVAAFEAGDDAVTRKLGVLGKTVRWDAWPIAGPNAQPWHELTVLEQQQRWRDLTIVARESGGVMLVDGVEIEPGQNVTALSGQRGDDRSIGVHLTPNESVRVLRSVLADAADAGYQKVVLQARGEQYPYPLMGYHLTLDRRAKVKSVPAREVDTIQVLVRMLDANCEAPGTLFRL